ncbi:MAG: type II toxin-antitoxin system RelE/ParE family toxin [Acidaminococcaceae bacterium]|nr:type II toxin-antitoxin system RelE/ParE family toxin [Acidaminococcaceae bacterium]MBQ7416915.1 type II toxin-antitoxin system RelE/ParE family toxin [Acidaminococcaceae bacterium]MBR1511324.1 type II toxin-antitoxin system RelE/ParE family toxin [Acidaminococcaceae bacterium]
MRYSVSVTEEAKRDLRSIINYIAFRLKSPMAAQNLLDEIEEQIEGLAQFPERFQLYELEPWHSRNLRMVSVKNFVILYIPDIETKVVNVYRIFYGKRDIAAILSDLSKRQQP